MLRRYMERFVSLTNGYYVWCYDFVKPGCRSACLQVFDPNDQLIAQIDTTNCKHSFLNTITPLPDGKFAYTADNLLKIWNPTTKKSENIIPDFEIYNAVFIGNEKLCILNYNPYANSSDLFLIDLKNKTKTKLGSQESGRGIYLWEGNILCSTLGKGMHLWDLESKTCQKLLDTKVCGPFGNSADIDNDLFITTGNDIIKQKKKLELWNLRSRTCLFEHKLKEQENPPHVKFITPNHCAVSYVDSIEIWDLKLKKAIKRIELPERRSFSYPIHVTPKKVLMYGSDEGIKRIDIKKILEQYYQEHKDAMQEGMPDMPSGIVGIVSEYTTVGRETFFGEKTDEENNIESSNDAKSNSTTPKSKSSNS